MHRIKVDGVGARDGALAQAVRAIRDGGIVAVPTDTLYGLAVDPFRADAVARVLAVKGRSVERALPLIAADAAQLSVCIGALGLMARRLAVRFWPGPLTLLMAAPPTLAPAVSGGTGKVGIRVPAHEVARALCRACGTPLTATSANVSGDEPTRNPDDVERALGDRIDVLVDAGLTAGGLPSTIVDTTNDEPRLVRAGAIAWDEIQACRRAA